MALARALPDRRGRARWREFDGFREKSAAGNGGTRWL